MRYVLFALLALSLAPVAQAGGKKGGGDTTTTASQMDVPSTLKGCIDGIDERVARIRALAAAGTMADIPLLADEVQRLATAMPLRSKELSAADQAVVQDATGVLKQQSGVVGRSATQNDQKALSDALATIDTSLTTLDKFQQ